MERWDRLPACAVASAWVFSHLKAAARRGLGTYLRELSSTTKVLLLTALYYLVREVKQQLTAQTFAGKTAIITGAGSGIGRLLSLRLAKQGAKIALWDVNQEGLNRVREEIQSMGGTAGAYTVDVTNRDQVYATAEQCRQDLGPIGVLINNAGIVSGKKIDELDDRLAAKTMEVNTTALFWTTKSVWKEMLAADSGHIVTIASAAGLNGVNGLVDYCASKFGAVGFHESMRLELRRQGKTGVGSTLVCPYFINTGMFDGVQSKVPFLLPILDPDYVVGRIVWAMQTRQTMLCLPRLVYFGQVLRGILPVSVADFMGDMLGVTCSMDEFTQTRNN